MKREIIFLSKEWNQLKEFLWQDRVNESGALALCKLSSSANHRRLIVTKLLIPTPDDYERNGPGYVGFNPEFQERAFTECVKTQSHLLDIHTHPFASSQVHFSGYDDSQQSTVMGTYISKWFSSLEVGFLVFGVGEWNVEARMWNRCTERAEDVDAVKILGRSEMKILSPSTSVLNSEVHTRTIQALGEEAQSTYSDLTVGIVGVGGLGSVVSELLSRLPVKKLILVDPDTLEMSNLNRFLGASYGEGNIQREKVRVVARQIRMANPSVQVEEVERDFLEKETQLKCKEADVLFGCSDSVAVRLALSQLAMANAIPLFDLGCGAVVREGELKAVGGQIFKLTPESNFCFHCSDYFDSEEAHSELLSDDERQRQIKQGYVDGDDNPEPSIYSTNMSIASLGVWWMMRYVTSNSIQADGISFNALDCSLNTWEHQQDEDSEPCLVCAAGCVGDAMCHLTKTEAVTLPEV